MIEDETLHATGTVREVLADCSCRGVVERSDAAAQPASIQTVERRAVEGERGVVEARI